MEINFPHYSYSASLELWNKVPYFNNLLNTELSMCGYVTHLDMPMSYLDQMFNFVSKNDFNPIDYEFSVYDFYQFLDFVFNKKIDMLELFDFFKKNSQVIDTCIVKYMKENNFVAYIFTYCFTSTDKTYDYIEQNGESTRNFYMMYENYLHEERMLIPMGVHTRDGVMTIRDVTKVSVPHTIYDDMLTLNLGQPVKSIRLYYDNVLVTEYLYNNTPAVLAKIHCPKSSTRQYVVVVRFKK